MKRLIKYGVPMLALLMFMSVLTPSGSMQQDSFWVKAAQSGMAEVALGNLAVQKGNSEQVKNFGQQMVTDHTAANNELMALAQGKNVSLPTTMDKKHQEAMNKLSGMSGAAFDQAFMKQMVKDHEEAVKLFQRESERGSDPDTKAFASKNLPVLQGHLNMARNMSGNVRGGGRNSGGRDMDSHDMSNGGNSNSNSNSGSDMNMNSNSNRNSNSNSNRNRNTNSNNSNGNSNRSNSNSTRNSNDNRR